MASHEKLRIAAIVVLCFVVYANALGGEFVYDDKRQILMNPLIQDSSLYGKAMASDVWAFKGDGTVTASNYYRPVFVAWLIVNFALFGVSPFGWHLTNVILHTIVSLIVYLLLSRKLDVATGIAFAIAIVFAVHPVHSESVAWVSGSPDLLFSVFFLGSAWFTVGAGRRRGLSAQLIIAAALYLLALGAKEIGLFLLPVYYLLLNQDAETNNGQRQSAAALTLPFALAAVLFFVIRLAVLGKLTHPVEDGVSLESALLTLPSLTLFYLRQLVLPLWLAVNHPIRPVTTFGVESVILPLILAAAAFALLLLVAKQSKLGRMGITLFVLTLVPAFNLTAFPFEQIAHDRYLYLPLLGFLMAVVPFVYWQLSVRVNPWRPIAAALLIVVVTSFSIVTLFNNRVWANEVSLWQHAAKIDPASAFTQAQLGSAYFQAGLLDQSVQSFDRSLTVRPTAAAFLGQGQALVGEGQFDRAAANAQKVVDTPLESVNAYTLYQGYELLAVALTNSGQFAGAEESLRSARQILPIYSASLTEKLAVVLYMQDRKAEALSELESARAKARRELLPVSKTVFLRLGMLYAEMGDKQRASADLNEFLRRTAAGGYDGVIADRQQAADLLRRLR